MSSCTRHTLMKIRKICSSCCSVILKTMWYCPFLYYFCCLYNLFPFSSTVLLFYSQTQTSGMVLNLSIFPHHVDTQNSQHFSQISCQIIRNITDFLPVYTKVILPMACAYLRKNVNKPYQLHEKFH